MTLFTNNVIIASFSVAIVSLIGMAAIISRRLGELKTIAPEKLNEDVNYSLVKNFYYSAKIFAIHLWANRILPDFYKVTEKILLKLESCVKKIEVQLERFSNYIRGKRQITNSKNDSKYWGGIIEFKNGLNGNDERKK